MYQHTRFTNNKFSFFQKFRNVDYVLLACILLLGFIRTKLLPFAIVSLFGVAFFAVSARIWLPGDMMSPAPIN